MQTQELLFEYNLLTQRCISTISRLMRYHSEVSFLEPIGMIQESDMQMTGVKKRNGNVYISTTSFGIINNDDLRPGTDLLDLQDYISIIGMLENQ